MAWHQQLPPPDPQLVKQLTEQQEILRQQVVLQKPDFDLKLLAGCDSSFIGENILSVFVVLSFPELKLVESVWHYGPVELPYIPGFLAFRESPNLVNAYQKLQHEPDLIMVDGHGIAHPRRLGIASQLGVLLNKPTMGVAKKVLTGKHEEPASEKGSLTPLTHRGEHIGNVIRTKDKVKPVFVSPGHLMDMETATSLVLQTALKHKLPEPTRLADHYAEVYKKEAQQ
ncbi:deoxyribonuclease V [Rufibacter tibetensis]|uniref:Endonuclease V n=1 Tax=Rufibacter tibetensis TaxID=512763 RepID=A0A0P0CVT4_9BACT|nr:deoxyribonuclease V [Rufibacter tibetensis]ALI98468.1 endonuclease V [Rufibacter tibetensis]